MKNKLVSFNVNTEDIRYVSAVTINRVLNRYRESKNLISKKLSKHLQDGSGKDVLESLKELLENTEKLQSELVQLTSLISEIEPLPPKAEVLEDLSDLEEDSLGVGSGGE